MLVAWGGITGNIDEAERALNMARDIDSPALLIRALVAQINSSYNTELSQQLLHRGCPSRT